MIILKYAGDITSQLTKLRKSKCVGFVPTMGALHQGHVSLLQKSREVCDLTIASIFINPTQFNNPDDFKKYPVTIENDIYLLEKNGCDILFMPDLKEIYPEGLATQMHFDLGYLETTLEGKYRPGHFQGVCRVVKRLLEIVKPTHLFIGQKDYQQCMVLKRLLQIMQTDIKLIICPTQRQQSGLAMSSRNARLSDEQKIQAAEIYKTLIYIKENYKNISLDILKKKAAEYLTNKNFIVDYVEIVNADDLKSINTATVNTNLVALIAAFIGEVRLIDNMIL